ncbi:hypothetical protein [Parvularcula maris]|uniref:VPLPA-CTERM sorting domain-containing protein n=1 Tax=Parvularcula maris TaxID=2965077 RepID=A0A9X2RH93_9PROT|nr:hypothetical protein [Parvularcula maris]MCQ8184695.1 hypothetical protein [Parvularcula maris]
MKKLLAIGLSAALMAGVSHAATITGGQTTITLTAVEELGLETEAVGEAQDFSEAFDQPVFTILITGDELTFGASEDELNGTITHGLNDGIALSSGATTVTLTNFVLDFDNNLITANVTAGAMSFDDAAVFEFELPDDLPPGEGPLEVADDLSGVTFTLTDTALTLLSTAFGTLPIDGDFPIGNFETNPEAVPVPAAALLFAPLAAGFIARRRRKAA